MKAQQAGYSGTPLSKKLGISVNYRVVCKNEPSEFHALLEPLPNGVVFESKVTNETDLVHVFEIDRAALTKALTGLRKKIRSDAVVWVSWPKKASKVPTDITEDTIRQVALPLGFVDIKVCAINEVWSGLKLVIRKGLRDLP